MENNKQPHEGHRQRMWQKYLEHGIGIFQEHELLEMLLYVMLPRVNTNETAHELISRFDSMKNVLETPVSELNEVKGIGLNSAVQLKFIGDIAEYVNGQKSVQTKFDSSNSIIDFCVEHYKNNKNECFSFYLLDDKLSLIYRDDIDIDKPNETEIDYNIIVKQAISFKCSSIVLSHNHPNGSAYASNVDIMTTRKLAAQLKSLGIKLIDHIVIQGDTGYSMRRSGEAAEIWY